MASKKETKFVQEIKGLLSSDKETDVLLALEKTRHHGTPELIPSLVDVLAGDTSTLAIVQEVTSILYELKDENCVAPLVRAMDRTDLGENRATVISSFWNAGLEASQHLDKFVQLAIHGSYMECVECITVIENMEGPFSEAILLDSMVKIREHMGKYDTAKQDLLMGLHALLEHIDRELAG